MSVYRVLAKARPRNYRKTDAREFPPPGGTSNHRGAIKRNMHTALIGKIFRQCAFARRLQIPAPVLTQLDIKNFDLKHVAGQRALYINGTGQKMRPGAALVPGMHLEMPLDRAPSSIGHVVRFARQRVDQYPVTRGNFENRGQGRVPESPMYGFGQRGQMMGLRHDGTPFRTEVSRQAQYQSRANFA